jgi:hypothetical protein
MELRFDLEQDLAHVGNVRHVPMELKGVVDLTLIGSSVHNITIVLSI